MRFRLSLCFVLLFSSASLAAPEEWALHGQATFVLRLHARF
jgi:hypothetical protein